MGCSKAWLIHPLATISMNGSKLTPTCFPRLKTYQVHCPQVIGASDISICVDSFVRLYPTGISFEVTPPPSRVFSC